MVNQLLGIHFNSDLQMPHFVNGRLLTAEDLQAEQDAMLARLRHLGRAAGYGVVQGLVVAPAAGANNLTISAGIGVNRAGDLIRLSEPGAQISLVITPNATEFGEDAGRFHDCAIAPTGTAISKGAYLLSVRPISKLEGSAPVKSLNGNLSTCESKWEVDGLEFVAIPLTKFTLLNGASAGGTTLRNLLAHWCFGSEGLKRMPTNPFEFGLKEYLNLHPANLADLTLCDLPLAVFTWTAQGLGILDTWAARRRIVDSYPGVAWDAFLSDARVAEAQARFLQFQEQLENVRATDKPATVAATKYFRYLPPAGFLPIAVPAGLVLLAAQATLTKFFAMAKATDFIQAQINSSDNLEAALDQLFQSMAAQLSPTLAQKAMPYFGGGNGFDPVTFFGERLPERIGLVTRETIDFRVNHSWYDEVIDLQEGTPFDILLVEDNLNRTLAALLFLMLDAEPLKSGPRGLSGLANSFIAQTNQLLPFLWRQTNLRQTYFASIAADPAVAVQEIAEGRAALNYALFVKRIPPVQWVSLQRDGRDDRFNTGATSGVVFNRDIAFNRDIVNDIDIDPNLAPNLGGFGEIRPDVAARILDRIAWASTLNIPVPPGGSSQPTESQPAEQSGRARHEPSGHTPGEAPSPPAESRPVTPKQAEAKSSETTKEATTEAMPPEAMSPEAAPEQGAPATKRRRATKPRRTRRKTGPADT
jgi:hypothetical protein